eukprot:TRINITY_DN84726_c0_g1_i1.p1 TRINITY_DN84726_c0_g1~~TRINITY_DN84726_c0_g1_i1.p1  ORF type:complete len:675 (-),score=159.81 TRINITY_DN84726_c0_g1_i1:157-2181(-)
MLPLRTGVADAWLRVLIFDLVCLCLWCPGALAKQAGVAQELLFGANGQVGLAQLQTEPRAHAHGSAAVPTPRPRPPAPPLKPLPAKKHGGPASPIVALGEQHHEALVHWLLLEEQGWLDSVAEPYTLVHLDSHADFGPPPAEGVNRHRPLQAMRQVNIANFLTEAAQLGLVDDVVFFAPPWETQCRQAFLGLSLEMVFGQDEAGKTLFARKPPPVAHSAARASDLASAFEALLEGRVLPWSERSRLRQPRPLRLRVVPAEEAARWLAAGHLFEGKKGRTRMLLDIDFDALSSSGPVALMLEQRGFSKKLLGLLHRLFWDFTAEPVAGAFTEDAAIAAAAASPAGAVANRTARGGLSKATQQQAKHKPELEEVLEPLLGAFERCPGAGCTAGLHAALRLHAEELLAAAEERGYDWAAEAEHLLWEFATQPYHESSEAEIGVLLKSYGRILEALPVVPWAVTLARSPFFSPKATVREQECGMLRQLRSLYPKAPAIRIGRHVDVWHHKCPLAPGETAAAGPQSWAVKAQGKFEGASASTALWQQATPERVDEVFGHVLPEENRPATDVDESDYQAKVVVEFRNSGPRGGRVAIAYRDPESEEDGGDDVVVMLRAGETKLVQTYHGHVWTARCAEGKPNLHRGGSNEEQVWRVDASQGSRQVLDIEFWQCARNVREL